MDQRLNEQVTGSVHSDKNVFCPKAFISSLAKARKQIDWLDQMRLERAVASNCEAFEYVVGLLPLLIHLNHPNLPAYLESAPEGIDQFELSDYQQQQFPEVNLIDFAKQSAKKTAFHGLYVMGSIGSISQTSCSDLDLWLFYHEDMDAIQYRLMTKKLTKITQWAKSFNIELNFYLMHAERFKAHQYYSDLSEEHCGSTQHFILLDEFYRSAVRLSGKPLLWLHIQAEKEHYEKIIEQAIENQCLNKNEWIDLGNFSQLSTNEYFGASLWQLYKGIDSPYKSLIKILLLESYAQTYPETNLISKQFKRKILSGETNYHFDPYLAMLEQVSDYLIRRQEFERLNNLRQSFYIKATTGEIKTSWRTELLEKLINSWQWSAREIQLVNQHKHWKIKQAVIHQKMLVDQLLLSYRNLIHFARKSQIDPSVFPNDVDILMRQLYSAFEVIPGKVNLINSQISHNLSEEAVTFIEAHSGSAIKEGWYLLNQAPNKPYNSETRFVQYEKDLNKLVAWAYFNGVITANTQLHLLSRHIDLNKLRQFITDLRLSFPIKAPAMNKRELHHPNEIRNLSVVINLVNDPTKKLTLLPRTISQSDLFNFGASEQNLVGSVSIIYRNVWNEIRTHHFEGTDAILKALKVISNKIYRSSAPPHSVNVFCYSAKLRGELRDCIANLVHKCIEIQTGTIFQKQQLTTLKVAGKTWQFIFDHKMLNFKQIPECVSKKELAQSYLYPKEISHFANEGFLQFFFENNKDKTFNVYILDEKNSIEIYLNCEGLKEDKIKEINRFYSSKVSETHSFNFPQFYQIIYLDEQIEIVPFQSAQQDYISENFQRKAY